MNMMVIALDPSEPTKKIHASSCRKSLRVKIATSGIATTAVIEPAAIVTRERQGTCPACGRIVCHSKGYSLRCKQDM